MSSSTQYMMIAGLLGLVVAAVFLGGTVSHIGEQMRDLMFSSSYLITEIMATSINNAVAFEENSISLVSLPRFSCEIDIHTNYVETRTGKGSIKSYYGLFLLEDIDLGGVEKKTIECNSDENVIVKIERLDGVVTVGVVS